MPDTGFQKIGDLLDKKDQLRPPAYPWQELALKVIEELNIPKFKRNAVFKVCRDNDKNFIEGCITDTKELCKVGEKWKYFFKVVGDRGNE